ncbi:hypothetical protein AYI69_g417 [Smittium culicis]|uniref:Uncharacterized protein n=1 Tax=Smittium culicis TaxID=133412 RepID=A0A1R1YT34_9FUNG|nr:hypothetical protein AYI69_g417 [Smittium culicis]
MNSDFATGCCSEVCGAGQSGMCPYAFSQCPEDPASCPDTLLEGQPSFLFPPFFGPPSVGRWQTGYFVVSGLLS